MTSYKLCTWVGYWNFTEVFEIAELRESVNINHHKLCSPFLSVSHFFLINRFIWTSAPGFLWHPEPGRSPVLRAHLFTISTHPAITALRLSPYWSSTRSSWKIQPSMPNGCKDPPKHVWLPPKVPEMFRHKPSNHYNPPTPPVPATCVDLTIASYCKKEQQRTNGWLPLSLLLPTDYSEDSWTNASLLIANDCSGTGEGGGTSAVTLKLSLSTLLHCFSTHFIKIVFFFFSTLHI